MPEMQVINIRLPKPQVKGIDRLIRSGAYPSRSEAVRDAVRELLERKGRKR